MFNTSEEKFSPEGGYIHTGPLQGMIGLFLFSGPDHGHVAVGRKEPGLVLCGPADGLGAGVLPGPFI